MRSRLALRLTPILLTICPGDAFAVFGRNSARLHQCIANLSQTLPGNVSAAVVRVDGADRQLLALRSYLRNKNALTEKWSWTAGQIARYADSPESRAAQEELSHIAKRFEAANPGYTLYVNSQVRSLDAQVAKWNENDSVGAAAKSLEKAAGKRLPRDGCAATDGKQGFIDFLTGWQPPRTPTLAAPGLSKHGQARAFDFQVKRGELIVAGTDSSRSISAWDKSGWTEKLRTAVAEASSKFTGPLKMPYEPWHYEYRP